MKTPTPADLLRIFCEGCAYDTENAAGPLAAIQVMDCDCVDDLPDTVTGDALYFLQGVETDLSATTLLTTDEFVKIAIGRIIDILAA